MAKLQSKKFKTDVLGLRVLSEADFALFGNSGGGYENPEEGMVVVVHDDGNSALNTSTADTLAKKVKVFQDGVWCDLATIRNGILTITAPENTAAGIILDSDEGDDAGDSWKIVGSNAGTGVLSFQNDQASKDSYVNMVTFTANATATNSTAAFAGHVTIGGDLTVNGTNTIINSTTLTVDDKNIELAHSPSGSSVDDAYIDGGGFTLNSSDGNKTILWTNSTNSWAFNQGIDIAVTDNTNTAFKVTQSGTGDILNLFDNNSEVFRVIDGGNTGIGTGSSRDPSSQLSTFSTRNAIGDVGNFANYHFSLRSDTGTNDEGIGIAFGNSTDEDEIGASIIFKKKGSASSGELQFYTKDSGMNNSDPEQRMVIDKDGKVGIGKNGESYGFDPDTLLEVYGTTTQQKWSYDANSFATMTVADASHTTIATGESGNLILDAAGNVTVDAAGGTFGVQTTGTSLMQLDAAGLTFPDQTLIKTTNRDLLFQTEGTDNVDASIKFYVYGNSSQFKALNLYGPQFGSALFTPMPGGYLDVTDSPAAANGNTRLLGSGGIEIVKISDTPSDVPGIDFRRKRDGTPTHYPQINDYLGRVAFFGYDSSNTYGQAAEIAVKADANHGDSGTDTPGRIEFWTTPDGSETTAQRMVIKSDGKIGIGTSSPSVKLDVVGDLKCGASSNLTMQDQQIIANSGNLTVKASDANGDITLDANGGDVFFKDDSVSLMTLNANGLSFPDATEVDIASGDLTLDVEGNIELNANGGTINFKDDSVTLAQLTGTGLNINTGNVQLTNGYQIQWGDSETAIFGNATSDYIRLKTAGLDRVSVDSAGKVGIGDISPDTVLHVVGNSGLTIEESGGTTRKLILEPPTATTVSTIRTEETGGGLLIKSFNGGNQIFLKDDGKVGIGTSIPSEKLTVDGNCIITGDLTINGSTTSINSTTVQVDDKNIELGTVDTPTDATANGGGITLKAAADKEIKWQSSTNRWTTNIGLHVNTTDALVVASGTTAERPSTPANGMIRYNTNLTQLEGYSNNAWIGLAGLQDADGDTRITAETTPGSDTDQLTFFVKDQTKLQVDSVGRLHHLRTDGGYNFNTFGPMKVWSKSGSLISQAMLGDASAWSSIGGEWECDPSNVKLNYNAFRSGSALLSINTFDTLELKPSTTYQITATIADIGGASVKLSVLGSDGSASAAVDGADVFFNSGSNLINGNHAINITTRSSVSGKNLTFKVTDASGAESFDITALTMREVSSASTLLDIDGRITTTGFTIGSTTITTIDEDMAGGVSGSHNSLATAKTTKDYIDNLDLTIDTAGDNGTTGSINPTQTLTVTGGSGITTSAAGQSVTVGLSTINTGKVLGNVSGSTGVPAEIEIDTDLETVSGSDNTLASAAAIKTYADALQRNIIQTSALSSDFEITQSTSIQNLLILNTFGQESVSGGPFDFNIQNPNLYGEGCRITIVNASGENLIVGKGTQIGTAQINVSHKGLTNQTSVTLAPSQQALFMKNSGHWEVLISSI